MKINYIPFVTFTEAQEAFDELMASLGQEAEEPCSFCGGDCVFGGEIPISALPFEIPEEAGISDAICDVIAERDRQKTLSFQGQDATTFDKANTQADWISFVNYYASSGSSRLSAHQSRDFRDAMVKAAALAIAAIESYDAGLC